MKLHPAFTFGPIAANLADAVTTDLALNRGFREGNPAMAGIAGNDPVLYMVKVGIGTAIGLGAQVLARKGHPKWAKAVSIFGMAAPLGAAVANGIKL